MKRNFFTAALESEVEGTVGADAVTEQSTLQPEVGVAETKGGEPSLDDIKTDEDFGTDAAIAEHDAIDTVAESQEHTLALEHLQATAMRFCRMGAALEEIAETVETNLEAGQPVDPATVQMVATAVDAAGIGEPLQECVALESFEFSANVATEGFVDALKERAEKVWTAVAKFAKKAWEITSQKLKRFADYFRKLVSIYDKLEKEGAVLATYSGKPFQNAKYEKLVQNRLFAPASTKTVVAAVDNAAAEYAQIVKLIDGKLSSDLQALNRAWKTEKADTVVAQMNKVLASARPLAEMGNSQFKHSSVSVEVNLPERVSLQTTSGLEGTKVVFEEGIMEFSAGVKTASPDDIKHLKASAAQAVRVVDAAFDNFWDAIFKDGGEDDMSAFFNSMGRGNFGDDEKDVSRKLLVKYSNLVRLMSDLLAGVAYGAAHGYYFNHFGASRWIRFSIAEAKAAKRNAA